MNKRIRHEINFFLELIFLFILPVILIYYEIIPKESRLLVLVAFSAIITFLTYEKHLTLKEMGFRMDNIHRKSILLYLLFTITAFIVLMIFVNIKGYSIISEWWTLPHFLFLFIPISFLQEFAFRGYLEFEERSVFHSPLLIILLNSLVFAFMHIIFPNSMLVFILTFAAGIGFATLFYIYPNLFLITICHMILNFIIVLYQIIPLRIT